MTKINHLFLFKHLFKDCYVIHIHDYFSKEYNLIKSPNNDDWIKALINWSNENNIYFLEIIKDMPINFLPEKAQLYLELIS